jgi:hypothetical protein
MMLATSVAILSLLQWARAESAAFSPLALSQRNGRPVQNSSRYSWWRPAKDEIMVRQPVNVLTRSRPEWGSREMSLIRSGGLEGSEGTASQLPRDHITGSLEI